MLKLDMVKCRGDSLRILIVGIGKLGEYLARSLVKDDNEVTLIDIDFLMNKDLINNEDVNYICGNGLDVNVLLEAGVKETDLLISVMDSDEQNVFCCLLAKKLGVTHTIARIRKPEFTNSINLIKEELGLSMVINPDLLTANQIAEALSIPSALETSVFLKGQIRMISLKVNADSPLVKMSINGLSRKLGVSVIICAIDRDNDIIIPTGRTTILENDKLYVTGTMRNLKEFLSFAHLISQKTKRVIISGGSKTAMYLADSLIDMGMQVKIIESKIERCKELSLSLPEALVICGDASDQAVLYEEGIEEADAFVALNSIDEENIVLSMFAGMKKVPKVITKVSHIDLDGILEKSNIDTVITPHRIAANSIVKYVRAMQQSEKSSCEAVYKFDDDTFEMLEFTVKEDFKAFNTKIKDMNLKENVLLAAILRGRQIIFPNGTEEIKPKDIIVIIDKFNQVKEINDILV